MAQADLQERLNAAVGSKYQVLYRLGGGGMSQVYLARHQSHGGLFAIKVLAEHLATDRNIVSRFEREARMTASLANHPNIVAIFDIGEGNGLYYLVMQFVAGEDLGSYLQRVGRLSIADAANVIAQAAEALSCAETQRIVHRDLKPGNMLLDETGRVKLLDFGISRIGDLSDGITRAGESMGTPYYMSPEQIRGEACDTRSDLYSLGVVFFELLTGKRPFENESTSGILVAHLSAAPPSLLDLDPQLPLACNSIVQRLIAKLPADRFQNTAELLQVLIANGASTAPGVLRPSMNDGVREAIERARTMPLKAATLSPEILPASTPVSTPVEVQAVTAQTSEPSSKGWLIFAGAATIVLVAVAAFFLFARSKEISHSSVSSVSSTASATPVAVLPQTYTDEHGKMLLVAGGDFHFGDRTDQNARTASLPAFYIDETEVSNAQYREFCKATGHAAPQSPDYSDHPDYPVMNVSYEDAAAYAAWAGRRLPTEEEWEKAARGTDDRIFPWGDQPWTDGIPNHLEAVSSEPLRRSAVGAYNMAGNVREWVATPYVPTPEDNAGIKRLLNGQSFSTDWRAIKGGSFGTGSHEDFAIARRRGLPIDTRSVWIGFRCVRSAAQTQ